MDGNEAINVSRRTLLAGPRIAGVVGAALLAVPPRPKEAGVATGPAPDLASLPRVKVDLVAPPFVHAHEQVAVGGPKVVEFTMTIEEKPLVIDDYGTDGARP